MTSKNQGYCEIWTEYMCSCAGNHTASAFIQILKKVASDHPNVTELILVVCLKNEFLHLTSYS